MTIHYIIQSVFILVGTISILASIFNWEWFFSAHNSQFIVRNIGRNNARILYTILGIVMIGTSIYFYAQINLL